MHHLHSLVFITTYHFFFFFSARHKQNEFFIRLKTYRCFCIYVKNKTLKSEKTVLEAFFSGQTNIKSNGIYLLHISEISGIWQVFWWTVRIKLFSTNSLYYFSFILSENIVIDKILVSFCGWTRNKAILPVNVIFVSLYLCPITTDKKS